MAKINLTSLDPLQVRRWILQLEDDPISGIRIKKNLRLQKKILGYSFYSNSLGLRGPENVSADNVILGTSVAMGMCVDNGCNWYEYYLKPQEWLNLGLPVGSFQIEALLNKYYKGNGRVAVILYHPNFWDFSLDYKRWSENGGSAISYFNWDIKWLKCYLLWLKRKKDLKEYLKDGRASYLYIDREKYHINSRYCYFDFKSHDELVSDVLACWERVINRFAEGLIIRIPTKQDLVLQKNTNQILCETKKSNNYGWNLFKSRLGSWGHVKCYEPDMFSLKDYYPWDGHWNPRGNKTFADYLEKLLKQ
jgi:hypothetical protein